MPFRNYSIKYLIILVLALGFRDGFSQFQLKGKLIAADTQSPLEAASVFLSSTSVGTVTNSAGEFELPIPAGKHDLIASFVGYETNARMISGVITDVLVIELQPKAKVFDEVVVGGYEVDGWNKWGKFFLENFIGTSDWASNCRIANYEVIKFRNDKKQNTLTATATDQLTIENKDLGYTIKYQLEDFEYNFKSKYLTYIGYPLFTEMAGTQATKKRWKKRRQDIYYGSIMHFMRALYRNRIVEEGYEVRRLVKRLNEEKLRVKKMYKTHAVAPLGSSITIKAFSKDSSRYYDQVLEQSDELTTFSQYTIPGDSIAYRVDSVTAGLDFENYLHVIYTKAAPPYSYSRLSNANKRMMSELYLIHSEPVQIQSKGNYYPPLNLVNSGYWAWSEKMANMLPYDYKPTLGTN